MTGALALLLVGGFFLALMASQIHPLGVPVAFGAIWLIWKDTHK